MLDTTKKAPAISREYINQLLDSCEIIIEQPEGTTSTFAHLYLPGGFYLTSGFSACVSPENFDAELGARMAVTKGLKQGEDELWRLEGYRLFVSMQMPTPEAA